MRTLTIVCSPGLRVGNVFSKHAFTCRRVLDESPMRRQTQGYVGEFLDI